MKETIPLSGRGEKIYYKVSEGHYSILWGDTPFEVSPKIVSKLLREYFQNPKAWYPLGASMVPIFEHGMGEFIANSDTKFTPRHASAIAAVLVKEGILIAKGIRPIFLSKEG